MDTRERIARELSDAPEDLLLEALHFIQFVKTQYQLELQADIEDAQRALAEAEQEGTTSWEDAKQELGL